VSDYERMLEDLAALGCDRPVLPGVMPFVSAEGLRRMAAMNRTAIPAELDRRLEAVAHDPQGVEDLGVEVAGDLCRRLTDAGAPGLHLYTLNRSASVLRLWGRLAPR
jgi:methylenetetrahydrofolate reductase (NADPH)